MAQLRTAASNVAGPARADGAAAPAAAQRHLAARDHGVVHPGLPFMGAAGQATHPAGECCRDFVLGLVLCVTCYVVWLGLGHMLAPCTHDFPAVCHLCRTHAPCMCP